VFQVKARDINTHQLDTFDLLRDKLVSTHRVVASDERHRGVDHRAMFTAIEDAHEALGELLATAVEAGVEA
jgi:hypothetical protein